MECFIEHNLKLLSVYGSQLREKGKILKFNILI